MNAPLSSHPLPPYKHTPLFPLGPDTTRYLFTTPRSGSGVMRTAITTDSNRGEYSLAHSAALPRVLVASPRPPTT